MRIESVRKTDWENERNRTTLTGEMINDSRVHLEYWQKRVNLGDTLAPVIYQWMLEQYPDGNLKDRSATGRPVHLMTVGSIMNLGEFDAAVWGTGILSLGILKDLYEKSSYRKLDIRAVRGPVTRAILENAGYQAPPVYGDPGILMPLIYQAKKTEPTVPYTVIPHYLDIEKCVAEGYPYLDIRTSDYKAFIDRIVKSGRIISSSLHGIILAEAYGVPSVLLNYQDIDLLKYYDYYFSTGRRTVKVASSIDEALEMEPMALPELSQMQQKIRESFPYDLFEK